MENQLKEILTAEIPSIVIGTKITLIEPKGKFTAVSDHKMGDFEKVISRLKEFKIKGDSKPQKLKKYITLAEKRGFKIDKKSIRNAGFQGKNSDVLSYNILFKK